MTSPWNNRKNKTNFAAAEIASQDTRVCCYEKRVTAFKAVFAFVVKVSRQHIIVPNKIGVGDAKRK